MTLLRDDERYYLLTHAWPPQGVPADDRHDLWVLLYRRGPSERFGYRWVKCYAETQRWLFLSDDERPPSWRIPPGTSVAQAVEWCILGMLLLWTWQRRTQPEVAWAAGMAPVLQSVTRRDPADELQRVLSDCVGGDALGYVKQRPEAFLLLTWDGANVHRVMLDLMAHGHAYAKDETGAPVSIGELFAEMRHDGLV